MKQSLQKEGHDQHCRTRQFEPDDFVMICSYLSDIDQLQHRSTHVSSPEHSLENEIKDLFLRGTRPH